MSRADSIRLSFALPGIDTTNGAPPVEFRIFAFGTSDTTKGQYVFDVDAADAVMSAFRDYGNRLTIDYEHQALSDPPVQAPAAASYVLELRADGLYATDVRWTEKAAAYLSAKEYLYFSPAFVADDKRRPTRLLNIALTNLPATKRMQSLVAASQTEKSMRTVLTALSLGESATEVEALGAITKLSEERRQVLASVGKESFAEAMGAITALKAQAESVVALTAELEGIKAERLASEVTGLLDEATKDGRIKPAKRAEMEALYAECGIKALKTCLSMLPKQAEPAKEAAPVAPSAPDAVQLTAGQLEIIKQTGLTPEQFAAHSVKYRQIVNPVEEK